MPDDLTPLPPIPSGLSATPAATWTPEEKTFYLNLRARRVPRTSAYTETRSTFSRAKSWPATIPQTVVRWEYREAKDYLASLRAHLRSDFSKLEFTQKADRIVVLGRLILSLLDRFDAEDDKGPDASHSVLVSLSKEIRPALSDIRVEVEGEGLEDARAVSTFERIMERVSEITARKGPGSALIDPAN